MKRKIQISKIQDKKFSLKQIIGIALATLLLTIIFKYSVFSNPSPTRDIYFDNLPSTTSYRIERVGTVFWATRYDGYLAFTGTDFSTVFQSVHDVLTKGGIITIIWDRTGYFLVYKRINITNAYLTIVGEGRGGSGGGLKLGADVDGIFYLDGYATMATFKDLKLFGDGDNRSKGYGIKAVWTCDIVLENCYIQNFKEQNVFLSGTWGAVVQNNYLEGSFRENLYLEDADNTLVIGNAMNWEEGSYYASLRIHDTGYGQGNTVVNNVFYDNYGTAIFLSGHTLNGSIISNNWIHGSSKYPLYEGNGIVVEDSTGNIISNNVIEGLYEGSTATQYGIYLRDATYNLIENNAISDTYQEAIFEYGECDYNIIRGNNINDLGITIVGANSKVKGNLGYVTENRGTATVANNEWVSHGLATTPTIVTVTTRTATYGTPAVAVVVGWIGQNATHFQVSAYWTNSTSITDDSIDISWYAEV